MTSLVTINIFEEHGGLTPIISIPGIPLTIVGSEGNINFSNLSAALEWAKDAVEYQFQERNNEGVSDV